MTEEILKCLNVLKAINFMYITNKSAQITAYPKCNNACHLWHKTISVLKYRSVYWNHIVTRIFDKYSIDMTLIIRNGIDIHSQKLSKNCISVSMSNEPCSMLKFDRNWARSFIKRYISCFFVDFSIHFRFIR